VRVVPPKAGFYLASILIVDDHVFMRKFVRDLIEGYDGWRVCGEAGDGKQAIEQTQLLKPDLITLDIHMPIMDGFQATRHILSWSPQTKILILSIDDAAEFSRAAASCGAMGFLSKSHADENLIEAINTLLRNETYFSHDGH
jgi:DNA-binding NarL/FixJ family response regulator